MKTQDSFIALLNEDGFGSDIPDTLIVRYSEASTLDAQARFKTDYTAALEAAQAADDEWTVSEVYEALKAKGWDFSIVRDPLILTY